MTRILRRVLPLTALLLFSCASAPTVNLPSSTRVLGSATVYVYQNGDRLEVIHDDRTNVVIVKLPDGAITILPLEHVGIEGRYRDKRMVLWEYDNGIVVWGDGTVVFSGTPE